MAHRRVGQPRRRRRSTWGARRPKLSTWHHIRPTHSSSHPVRHRCLNSPRPSIGSATSCASRPG